MRRFLLVVFDGLRPDLVRPDTTPHLLRFASIGSRFTHARSVFPSETRVCSASIATGCHPRRHGLVANQLAHPLDRTRIVDTGRVELLLALEQEIGIPLLEVPTLGEILGVAGRDCTVLSSGTTGQALLLNPCAMSLGHVTLSAHGRGAGSPAGARLFDSLAAPPADAPGRAEWIAEVFRTRLLPDPPALTVLWLCEPDSSAHFSGLGSTANLAALRRVDAAFGRIVDDWQAGPHRDTLQVAVASDHGHATVSAHVELGTAFADALGFAGCALLPGSSGGVTVPGSDADRIGQLAAWLMQQPWAGTVHADLSDRPAGILSRAAVLANHPRGADLLFTLRTDPHPARSGLPGTTLDEPVLALGAGNHGGLSAAEMNIVLMLAGSAIQSGISELPAGLTDIAPTVLALLDLPGGADMDGRVLAEAMHDHPPPGKPASEIMTASNGNYAQRLERTRLGRHLWLDVGMREGELLRS